MIAVPRQQGGFAPGVGDDKVEMFNVAALWRYEAIVRLGLEGESMIAASAPGRCSPDAEFHPGRPLGSTDPARLSVIPPLGSSEMVITATSSEKPPEPNSSRRPSRSSDGLRFR